MPGLLLANSFPQELFEKHAASVLHDKRYRFDLRLSYLDLLVGTTGFEGYPTEMYRFGDFDLLFEGMAYHQTVTQREADFRQFFDGNQLSLKRVKGWIEQADGSFILLAISRLTQEVYLFNDPWGRLPVYYWTNGSKFVLSREIAFVRLMSENTDYCQFGAAENLLFGFSLGTRTSWKNISKIPPACMLRLDLKTSKYTQEGNYLAFASKACVKAEPEKLLQLFTTSVQNRLQQMKSPVLSLSGGLDSRLVAAVMAKEKLEIQNLTYTLDDEATSRDQQSVEAMDDRLGLADRHQFYKLASSVDFKDVLQLLIAKQGLNYAGMAFLLPFLRHFAANNYSMLTGDGGDKLLADLRPLIPLKNEQQVLQYILRNHTITPFHLVCKWLGISKHAFENHLLAHLKTYEALSADVCYEQFLMRERVVNWLLEGEDRNRIFCWSETPFYNPLFAAEALSIAMEAKANGQLFADLLALLPGHLHQVVNPNWQLALTEKAAIERLFFRQRLKQKWPIIQAITSLRATNAWDTFPLGNHILESLGDVQGEMGLSIEKEELMRIKNMDSLWNLLGMLLLRHNVVIK